MNRYALALLLALFLAGLSARERIDDTRVTHWVGCERDHRECLIQRMADEIERLRAERDEQPHPLAGQHINQGSMDAAADAYEAEYNAARGISEADKD